MPAQFLILRQFCQAGNCKRAVVLDKQNVYIAARLNKSAEIYTFGLQSVFNNVGSCLVQCRSLSLLEHNPFGWMP